MSILLDSQTMAHGEAVDASESPPARSAKAAKDSMADVRSKTAKLVKLTRSLSSEERASASALLGRIRFAV